MPFAIWDERLFARSHRQKAKPRTRSSVGNGFAKPIFSGRSMMTVSSISLASSMYQNQQTYGQSNSQQIRQEFKDLGGALQSSDQSGANTAYAVLQQLLSNVLAGNQTSSGSTSGDTTTTDASVDPLTSAQTGTGQSSDAQSTFSTDFAALGQALQSGDISQAKNAFQTLQQDMQSVGHHHHHHHHGSFNTQTASDTASSTDTGSVSGDSTTTDASVDPLTGAQTGTGQSSDAQSTFSTDFAALGQALQSGDISQAQNAFQTLQQDMQSVGHRHHHFASFYAQAALDTTAASSAGLVSDNVDSVDLSV
jgi:hypothetical protein